MFKSFSETAYVCIHLPTNQKFTQVFTEQQVIAEGYLWQNGVRRCDALEMVNKWNRNGFTAPTYHYFL